MKTVLFELRLALQSRLASAALALLTLLGILAGVNGMQTIAAQEKALQRIAATHATEVQAIAGHYREGGEAGYAAYQTPHLTSHPAGPLAFAAIGQRDVQPFALRVRLLGLQGQLYESENINPQLAAAGRFDPAFVLVYLAPLFIIVLTHDLVTSERESGRLRMLAALPLQAASPWRLRLLLRFGLLLAATLVPLGAFAVLAGGDWASIAALLAAVALYLAFWFGLCTWVAARAGSSAASAAVLLACHVLLTLVLPSLLNAAIVRQIPTAKGAQLALAQRQEVHQGWDLPKPVTLEKFFRTHPEWRGTEPVTGRFHWKWYYAMHQAGDDAVAPAAQALREDQLARAAWTERAGLLLAPVNLQVLLHRLAGTDLEAQLAYQDRVAAFHAELRKFYYPYIFNEKKFGPADFAATPAFKPIAAAPQLPLLPAFGLAALAALAGWLGLNAVRRVAVNR
jgi:ABC-2 type transport system permease protein